MAYQNRNIFNVVRARQNGKPGMYGQNSVACFTEDVAASSVIDNKACSLPGSLRSTFLVVFSHDQTLMASSHGNHCIYVTRISTAQCIQTLEGHPRTPWCVTFHPTSNEILASGCLGGEVRVWDLQGSSEVWVSEHCTMIASLAFHPHDQVLAIATDNQILLWDWRQPEPFASVKTTSPLEKVRLVRFDPLGHFMLTGITNVNEDDTDVDVDIATPRESMVSGDHSSSSVSRAPVNPDNYPDPSQPEPPPPPPPPPLRIPSLHYGTRRQLSLGSSPSSSSSSIPSAVARPASPDQESRITDAQDYAAAVTLSALGLRRVSSRQYRAQRENDTNRMRGMRSFTSFEEARYAYSEGGGAGSSSSSAGRSAHSEGGSGSSNIGVSGGNQGSEGSSITDQSTSQPRYAHLRHYVGTTTIANDRSDRNSSERNSDVHPSVSRRDPGSSSRSLSSEPLTSSQQQQDRTEEDQRDSGLEDSPHTVAVHVVLPSDEDITLPADAAAAADDSNSQSTNANFSASSADNLSVSATNPTTSQSPRSLRRPRFMRSSSSSSAAANSTFEFYRRGRRMLASHTPSNYEGSSPSGNNSLRQQPTLSSDAQLSSASDMGGQAVRRPRRAAWESSSHASHWRRIETRHTINPDIGAAHTAHLGRVPDTSPPPPRTRGRGSNTHGDEAGPSAIARGDGVEAEVAERSRPTLLMASPSPSVPSATIAPALPTSSYSARRTIPALIHHGHARRHMYHMGQDRPLRRERDESGSPGGPETRRARLSRYGFSRTSLGRRTSQAALHRHYARHSSIFDEENRPPSSSIHHYINRAIANAFAGRGETAVANNIGNTTYRLQWWDFQDFQLPDISRAETNIVVPNCKLHNDGSCDISQDGSLLAVFVPSPLGFPDDGVLAIYSLKQHNFGEEMYTKSFGPNAITVSLSPLGGYVMVGLAARKLHWHMSTKQLMAQIFRLAKPGTEESLVHVMDVKHPNESDRRSQISVNIAKWLPQPGRGFVYGTNRGHLRICTPRYMVCAEADDTAAGDADSQSSDDDMYSRRINLVHRRRSYQELRSLAMRLQPSSSGGSTSSSGRSAPERNARGTQTARRIQFSIATQTDDVNTNNTSAQSATNSESSGNVATTSSGSVMTVEVPNTSSAAAAVQQGNADQSRTDSSAPSTSSRDSSTQIVGQTVASTSSNTPGSIPLQSTDGGVQHADYSDGTSV